MNKKLLILLVLFFNFYRSQAQCAFTGTPLTSVGTYTFCIDNNTTFTTPSVASGQFALVNVVKGFRYSFSIGKVFTGNENLTILNAADNSNVGAAGYATGNGASITNWTSTLSGQIKVLLSRGACVNDNTAGGSLTLTLLGVGNTQDDQTNLGINQWVGHIYNWTGTAPPGGASPTTLSNSNPFTVANYVGYYNVTTETINENFGGDNACFPVMSGGSQRAFIGTEQFAVRYRMRSTKTAGCYVLNVNGDDGVRVYVDGVLVFDRWVEQSNTSYCNNLVNLTGNSNIVLDYYENAGQNVTGFSLTPFNGSTNTISSSTDVRVCSNTASTITASNIISCNVNTNTVYQWQSSSDNITFTNISGANAQNYTVPGFTIAAGAANNVRYLRRVFKPSTLTAGTCEFFSNVVTVTTSGAVPSAPSAVSGSQNQCRSSSGTFSMSPVTNAISYNWTTTAVGWIITPATNGLSATVAFSATAASGDLRVSATNGCGTSSNFLYAIQVRDLPTSATILGTASVCVGAVDPVVTISNPQAYIVNVTYNINGGTNVVVPVGANASANFTVSTSTTGTFIYNLVNVSNPSSLNCSTNLTGSATVTVGAASGDQVSYGTNSWIGYVYAGSNPQNSNFSTNFVGSISQVETFDLNLDNAPISGTGICGTYADDYAVRFKMKRNLPAGCYTFTVGADDGYRLSLDGGATFVVNNWTTHSYQEQTYVAYLAGNTNFVLEYFEATGQARVRFLSSFVPLEKPIVAATVQPNCITTSGSVRLTGMPSGAWTLIRSGSSGISINGTGSETTITGLAPGTYAFAITSGSCSSTPTGNVVIDPVITTTYTGSTWSVSPTIDMLGIINSNVAIASNVELCNCTINTGVVATVASGVTLKLQDKLTVNGSGTLIFEDGASLVQINNVANVGNIKYKRLTTPIRNTDYTYWSSPVLGFTLGGVSPRTLNGKFYSYEVSAGSEDWKQESSATIMSVGKGYIVRGPETTNGTVPWPVGQYLATFNGVPNNGNHSLSGIFADKSYLIGNPYPSALDANKFLTDNAGVLDGTLYFWTHNTSIGIGVSNPGSGAFAYSGDDYASYNFTGGTATAAAPSDADKSAANPYIPTGKIAAGQSFFASSKVSITGSSILFDNSMRVGVGAISGTNSQFFRSAKNAKTALVVEQNRVWLNLFNNEGAFKQTLVGYVTGATNNYDNGYDGETFDANEFVDFYSVNQEENLVIQGRALPFDENDKVLLGFRSTTVGNFNIGIDQTDGILKTQNIFVEDKLLNIVHDLKTAPYVFTSLAGTFNDRFVLRFTQKTLGLDSVLPLEKVIVISKYKNELKIKSETETIERITVFDLLGRKIFDKQSINNTEFRIVNNNIVQQILIVKVVLEDGNIISKKIM